MSDNAFPLPRGPMVSTRSLEELRTAVSRETVSRRFSLTDTQDGAHFSVTHVDLPGTRVFGCRHSVPLRCESAPLDCFEAYCVGAGMLVSEPDSSKRLIGPAEAVIHFPGDRVTNAWGAGFKALVIRVHPESLVPYLGYMVERRDLGDRHGPCSFSLAEGLGRCLINLATQICHEPGTDSPCADMSFSDFEDLLHHNLALILERHLVRSLPNAARAPIPAYLRRAVDFVNANLEEPISLASLAAAAGMTARTVQYAFAKHFGTGPMAYIKQAKMERVRRELQRACNEDTTVTEVAMRWGFSNLSNFSRNYRLLYGESPSTTLRRVRAHRRAH